MFDHFVLVRNFKGVNPTSKVVDVEIDLSKWFQLNLPCIDFTLIIHSRGIYLSIQMYGRYQPLAESNVTKAVTYVTALQLKGVRWLTGDEIRWCTAKFLFETLGEVGGVIKPYSISDF